MNLFAKNQMVVHQDDLRPMLVVDLRGEEVFCKFPGSDLVKSYPARELTPYKPSGPMTVSF